MTNNNSAPDLIEIGGIKYKKVVEEPKKPQTLYDALQLPYFTVGYHFNEGQKDWICKVVEKWLPEEIELDVNNDEFSLLDRGYNSYRDRAIKNIR